MGKPTVCREFTICDSTFVPMFLDLFVIVWSVLCEVGLGNQVKPEVILGCRFPEPDDPGLCPRPCPVVESPAAGTYSVVIARRSTAVWRRPDLAGRRLPGPSTRYASGDCSSLSLQYLTGMPAFSASLAVIVAPLLSLQMNARHTSAPRLTISLLRSNPARFP